MDPCPRPYRRIPDRPWRYARRTQASSAACEPHRSANATNRHKATYLEDSTRVTASSSTTRTRRGSEDGTTLDKGVKGAAGGISGDDVRRGGASGLLSYRGGMGDRGTGDSGVEPTAAANAGVASVVASVGSLSAARGVGGTSGPGGNAEFLLRSSKCRGIDARDVRVLASRAACISAWEASGYLVSTIRRFLCRSLGYLRKLYPELRPFASP